MSDALRFDYRKVHAGQLPFLPITLQFGSVSFQAEGLLDTGSTVNVLPYDVGLQLGAAWEQQLKSIELAGNLSRSPAKAISLQAKVAHFSPVKLAFAWTRSNSLPLILGQMNFFLAFDVCFLDLNRHLK